MSWTLFIGGIMAGFVALWAVIETVKRDAMKNEESAKETNVPEIQDAPVVCSMTAEEYNARMNAIMDIFAIK